MFLHFRQPMILFMLLVFGVLPLVSETKANGDHIVTAADLRQAMSAASHDREVNLARIDKFLATDAAKNAFSAVRLDPAKVSRAIASLSDDEIARLARQSEKVQRDVAAGSLSNQQITYILIALATAVIILVIVAAR